MTFRSALTRAIVFSIALSILNPPSLCLAANASAASLANAKENKSKIRRGAKAKGNKSQVKQGGKMKEDESHRKQGAKTKGKGKGRAKAFLEFLFHIGVRTVSPELDDAIRNLKTKPKKNAKKVGKTHGAPVFARGRRP